MEYGDNCWVAITEARIEIMLIYIGTNGIPISLQPNLYCSGEPETGVKASFHDESYTPWRVLMIGNSRLYRI